MLRWEREGGEGQEGWYEKRERCNYSTHVRFPGFHIFLTGKILTSDCDCGAQKQSLSQNVRECERESYDTG